MPDRGPYRFHWYASLWRSTLPTVQCTMLRTVRRTACAIGSALDLTTGCYTAADLALTARTT